MIVKMEKISIIGMGQDKAQIIEDLMELEAVQLNTQEAKLSDGQWAELISPDSDEETAHEYEARIGKVSVALDTLERYVEEKKPLFKTRRVIARSEFDQALDDIDGISRQVDTIYELNDQLAKLKADENRIQGLTASLKPWLEYPLELELSGTKATRVEIGVLPVTTDTAEMMKELLAEDYPAVIKVIGSDSDQHYISVIYHRDHGEVLHEQLKKYGFTQTVFKDLKGTPAQNAAQLEARVKELEAMRDGITAKIKEFICKKNAIESYHDSLTIIRDRARIRTRLLNTEQAFYLDGYVPCEIAQAVEEKMEKYDTAVEFTPIEKGEEFPVKLKNNALVIPFESITNLYSVPLSTGIDPTPFFTIFYIMFYGMMFSDGGYGVVMAVVCFVILQRFNLEGMARKLIAMLAICGLSTVIWGALFGGWFGDFIQVTASNFFGTEVNIPALWFNPLDDPMKLLIFSLALGVIHIYVGMGLKAYMLIRDGHLFSAIVDVFSWFLFLTGGIMLLAGAMALPGVLTRLGMIIMVVGAAILILTQGRKEKNIFMKVIKGIGSIYNITSYLSLILSYSRLLALGLATGVVASVVNVMGSLAGGGILGAIVMLIAFCVGHTFNFAINALGSFVHSSRLQYVEFFGEFFEGGGDAFEPFAKKTKYIDIK